MQALGLNLDFLFGHGYLSARDRALGPWASASLLRMEIPDLSFPFDARGGVDRFRNTRCHLRQIQLTIGESALQAALTQAMAQVRGFEDLQLRFEEGAALLSARYRTLGSDTFITFRAGVLPPEPPRADALHVLIYDVRAYGPVPFPARLLVSELLARLLEAPVFSPRGRGPLFEVSQQGDLLTLHPIKLALMALFPQHGWKLPGLTGVRYEAISLQPGSLTLTARADGQPWDARGAHDLLDAHTPGHGASASIAAFEARELCRAADERLWSGELESALDALRGLEHRYGLHPAVASRALDLLLAAPGAGHVAEARALTQRLLRADPQQLHAHLAMPTAALLRGDRLAALEHYTHLAALLRARGEREDLVCCLLATATLLRQSAPLDAVHVLREVTQLAPLHRGALELLRDLYEALDRPDDLLDVLRRLAGMAASRDAQLDLFERLARLLMRRRADLGEARLYLEKLLALDPDRIEALHALAESYLLDDQPLRALGAFGTAARVAAHQRNPALAAQLHLRVAELWSGPLDDPAGALLASRRALEHIPDHEDALATALHMALRQERFDEALPFAEALIPLREAALEQARGPEAERRALHLARQAHLDAATVAVGRGRPDAASAHHRQALRYRRMPTFGLSVEPDPSVEFLDHFFRQMGRPEDLLDLYRAELHASDLPPGRRAELHRRLATIFDEVMGLGSEAVEQLQRALEVEPHHEESLLALARIMARDARHFELRDLLLATLPRLQDRRARGLALRALGQLHLDALPDPQTAAGQLRQAQVLRPADPELAGLLVQAERALRLEDPQADARPLLRALQRLSEVSARDDQRRAALVEAGDLCYTDLQRPEQAADFYRRAAQIFPDPHTTRRLEQIHASSGYPARPSPPTFQPAFQAPEPAPADINMDVDAEPTPDHIPESNLQAFRERFQSLLTRPASLEESRNQLPQLRGARPASIPTPPPSLPPAEIEEDEDEPPLLTTDQILQSLHDDLREEFDEVSLQEISLADLQPPAPAPEPAPTPTPTPAPTPAPPAPTPPDPEEAARALREARAREAMAALSTARESGDPTLLRDALEEALGGDALEPHAQARLLRELGLLCYYDLEQPAAAEAHLRQAMSLDRDGVGLDFDVLTALEGIYEDLGDASSLLEVYRRKRHGASDPNMRQVYGLLIAELLWERLGRVDEAALTLEELLSRDPGNVPARRMLADIARRRNDTAHALELLRELASSQPSGSFELQECLRELGQVLLEHIDRAEGDPALRPTADDARHEAAEVYRLLLREVPGDSDALTRRKALLATLGDHVAGLALLGTELELLLAQRGAFPGGPDPAHLGPREVAVPLHLPVAQILTEAAHLWGEREDSARALAALDAALALWPEHIDALSLRLALRRALAGEDAPEVTRALIDDLRAFSELLLNPAERVPLLAEAASLAQRFLRDRDGAAALLGEAAALAEEAALDNTQELQEALLRLRNEDDAALLAQLVELPTPDDDEPPSDPAPPSHSPRAPREQRATQPSHSWRPDEDEDADPSLHEAETTSVPSLDRPAPADEPDDWEQLIPPPPLTRGARLTEPPPLPASERAPRATNPFGFAPKGASTPPPPPGPSSRDIQTQEMTMPAIHLQDEPSSPSVLDLLPPGGPQDSLDEALSRLAQAESKRDRHGMLGAVKQALDALPSDAVMSRAVRRQLLVVRAEILLAQRAPGAPNTAATIPASDVELALDAAREALSLREVEEPEAWFLAATAHHLLGQRQQALDLLLQLARESEAWPEDEGPLSLPLSEDGDQPPPALAQRILDTSLFLLGRSTDRERGDWLKKLSDASFRLKEAIRALRS